MVTKRECSWGRLRICLLRRSVAMLVYRIGCGVQGLRIDCGIVARYCIVPVEIHCVVLHCCCLNVHVGIERTSRTKLVGLLLCSLIIVFQEPVNLIRE
ncbi:hypothetical protein M011DRAFT_15052 [Sporormia fimetaria CBS 119925]|uniref:Uncharacterized protein n=1 Tax=Sporormia fimetaria CBS 119925 TaxID=1340428 RepID=A0A6A6VR46_9PLEO|nr:hypothetical protein M011DRAFT_15052 [Sporormia fimetaria CBS 119925]